MNTQIVSIENTQISVISYQNKPVITSTMLADLYGTDEVRIRQNHNENKDRFVEGKHFYKLEGESLRNFKKSLGSLKLLSANARHFILWTERGAARHAKMLDTDQAWDIFEKLEDTYFGATTTPTPTQNLNAKISNEQAGVLFNIVHGRACGNAKQIIEMWGRLKRHFRYSTYHNLKAIHFEEAVQFLESMELHGEVKAIEQKEQYFLRAVDSREFNTRLRSLFDIAGLMASRGDDIAAVFQRQAKDLNKFMAGA